jgi:glycosyltransferase involved in cell wall biosynthesis
MQTATRISSYVLTLNSDRYLQRIVRRLRDFSDEVLIIDSGSTDRTHAIAKAEGCRLIVRAFDDFRSQRQFAVAQCRFEYVFFCDCDEIPSDALVTWIAQAKRPALEHDLYRIRREWTAFGRRVHGVCPTPSPDYPVRLLRRSLATYERSTRVHEGYDAPRDAAVVIEAPLEHLTFDTNAELRRKLRTYSRMAAEDMAARGWSPARLAVNAVFSPPAAFLHWYVLKRNMLDGWAGVKLAAYAAAFKFGKYAGALGLQLRQSSRTAASDTA